MRNEKHKIRRQGIMRKKKSKNTTVFVLAIYCFEWGLVLRMVCVPSENPLEKTKVLLASGYILETASELWMWACVHFHSQDWNLWRPCACCHSLFQYISTHVNCVLEGLISLVFCISSGSLNPSTSSYAGFPKPWGGGEGLKISHLRWIFQDLSHCPAVGFYIYFHLFHQEDSQILTKKDSDLWVQQNVIKSLLLLQRQNHRWTFHLTKWKVQFQIWVIHNWVVG